MAEEGSRQPRVGRGGCIRIQGELVADLDYSPMFARLGSLKTITRELPSANSRFISPNLADQIEESLGDGITELPFLGRR
jgi:hypothetical protein